LTSSDHNVPTRTEPGRGLRARILQTAIELFATHGYGATSMRAIVEAVGCTKPALYYHFGSKAELFVEVHRTVQGQVRAAFVSLPRGDGPLALRLERFIATLLDAAVEDPFAARLLLTATHRPEQGQPEVDLESLHSHNLAHLSNVLQQGQEHGEIRTDLSAVYLSDFLLGMVHHRALGLLRGEVPPPGISQQIIDVFIHGARS
jgi:AcrR family transcriptional regulator